MSGSLNRSDFGGVFGISHLPCRCARIDNAVNHSILDQGNALAPHALAIEWRTCLQWMVHVIAYVDVLAE